MKNYKIVLGSVLLFSIVALFSSCNNLKYKADESFLKNLKENRLGNTSYYISLPDDYILKESIGPDFNVYYFYSSDTTNKKAFSGGIYFGGYPSEFKADADSYKTEKISGKLLDRKINWTVFNCNEKYIIQTVIEQEPSQGYIEKIHVFGYCVSKKEADKLFGVFSTFESKK